MFEPDHERHMQQAIALAVGLPELPFGTVIVHRKTGEILAKGCNSSMINPTWHGEIVALNKLFQSLHRVDGSELVLYTTAEPCPMCMAAILWSDIGMVVFGTSIEFLQMNGWRQIDISTQEIVRRSPGWTCTVTGGVLEQQCNALFAAGPPTVPEPF